MLLGFIGWGIYTSQDDDVVQRNNDAISAFNSGQSDLAINQFQQASQEAVSKENKVESLKNLGYVNTTEGNYAEALSAFKQALTLTGKDSFNYYLISGEIAVLEGKPNSAYISFNKAYSLNPESFQINNSLALFHIDLEEIAPQYTDYPKALKYAQKAYSLQSDEIGRQNLGIAHYFNDNYIQAINLLSQTNLDQHPYMALWLGLAYAGNGDVTNAKSHFRTAIAKGVEIPQEVYDYLYNN